MVNRLYQDSNSSPATDVKFSGGVIQVSMPTTTLWEFSQYQQVRMYTGVSCTPNIMYPRTNSTSDRCIRVHNSLVIYV